MKFRSRVAPIAAAIMLSACGGGGGGGDGDGGNLAGNASTATFAVNAAFINLYTNANVWTAERTDPLLGSTSTISMEYTPLSDGTFGLIFTRRAQVTMVERVGGMVVDASMTEVHYQSNPFFPIGNIYSSDGDTTIFTEFRQMAPPVSARIGDKGYLSTTMMDPSDTIKIHNTWDLQRDTDSTAWLCMHSYLPLIDGRESDCFKIDRQGTVRGAAYIRKVRGAMVTYMPVGQTSGTTPTMPASLPVPEPTGQPVPSGSNSPAPSAPAAPQPAPSVPSAPAPAPIEAPASDPPPQSTPAEPTPVDNAPFAVNSVSAPANGATVSGTVTLVVSGSGLVNVELLPASGYTPMYARFAVSEGGTSANLAFDTRSLPNGEYVMRISAFNAPAGDGGASEIIAMPARSWIISN